MKLIKLLSVLIFCCFTLVAKAQNSASTPAIEGYTSLSASFLRLGSYSKERPTFFIEQDFDYRFNDRVSLGLGLGFNLYPALLAFPVALNGKYYFKINKRSFLFKQSIGRNIRLADIFFSSNRYLGSFAMQIPLKQSALFPEVGYNFLWDRFGGKNVGFFLGISWKYTIKRM